MPKLRSLRAKMLALILLPVIVALAAVTLLAISRASSAQEKSAYAELNQRTAVESAKVDSAVAGVQNIANSAALILSTSNSRADAIAGMTALQTAAKGSVVAVFGGLLPNTFGSDAGAAGQPGTLPNGSFQPSVALDEKGKIAVTASKDGLKGAETFVKTPMPGVQEPAAYEGTMYVTYQAAVQRGGKVVGYAGTANTLALIDGEIGKMKFYESGYAFAISAKGVLIASPDKAQTGKVSLAELAAKTGQRRAQAGRGLDRGRQERPDRDQGPVHGQGRRPHVVEDRRRGLELPHVRPAVRGARPGQEPADHAVRRRPDRADPHQPRDRVRREPAHQADPHRHRGRRARRRG